MGTLLVIGSGRDLYREYILQSAARRHTLLLLQENPASWQQPYIADHASAVMADQAAMIEAARNLCQRHGCDGIFTYEEQSVELTAAIAATLHLPYNSPASVRRCRDKLVMRQTWEAAGVPSARSRLVGSQAEAEAVAAEIGYPVVLKPRAIAASVGVVRADSAAELGMAYRVASGATLDRYEQAAHGVLVEEYLEGPEISVESVVVDGQVQILATTHKQVGFAPFFEEIGHVVSASEPLPEATDVADVVHQAHRALGVQMGATHAELRLTSTGPRMIELGARMGGDLIPYLVFCATGIDVAAAATAIAARERPELMPTRQRAAAIRFIYPDHDIRVRALGLDPRADQLPWLDRVVWNTRPGDERRLPPRGFIARLGFAIVTGADMAECQARLEQVEALMQLDLEHI